MKVWQLLVVSAVIALIGWLVWSSAPVPPGPRDPVADAPWGPGKNRLNCETGELDQPLPPELDAAQRARVLALLKQACQEPTRQ